MLCRILLVETFMMKDKAIGVISICSKSHADVWKLTSNFLPQFVKANSYQVFVPEVEVDFFKSITSERIEVRAQEELSAKFVGLLNEKFENSLNPKRFGWYLQQFLKIEALRQCPTEYVAIWDADCVPVKEIELMNNQNQPVYVDSSREFHSDYFDNIERLLGMKRIQPLSFVIPGFPMKKSWIDEFIDFVEERHQTKWYQAIMNSTNFELPSGFSETETLGTWIANTYPEEWSTRPGTWERYGQSRFGFARRMTPSRLLEIGDEFNLEIITFENWDTRGYRRIIRALKKIKIRYSR